MSDLKQKGTYKNERVITSKQSSKISTQTHSSLLNFCANNYLGLCDNPEIIKTAQQSLEDRGFGLSSVRFICGTTDKHLELENKVSEFYE